MTLTQRDPQLHIAEAKKLALHYPITFAEAHELLSLMPGMAAEAVIVAALANGQRIADAIATIAAARGPTRPPIAYVVGDIANRMGLQVAEVSADPARGTVHVGLVGATQIEQHDFYRALREELPTHILLTVGLCEAPPPVDADAELARLAAGLARLEEHGR